MASIIRLKRLRRARFHKMRARFEKEYYEKVGKRLSLRRKSIEAASGIMRLMQARCGFVPANSFEAALLNVEYVPRDCDELRKRASKYHPGHPRRVALYAKMIRDGVGIFEP